MHIYTSGIERVKNLYQSVSSQKSNTDFHIMLIRDTETRAISSTGYKGIGNSLLLLEYWLTKEYTRNVHEARDACGASGV